MSIHKLTAGSGYDYLTRQVAAQDVTERGHSGLASYYTAKGESPGTWVGSGLGGLEGVDVGDIVTAEQMRNLFGSGRHPLAEELRAQSAAVGLDIRGQEHTTWLGRPYPVHAEDVSEFRRRVAQRVSEAQTAAGQPAGAPVSLQVRARIRTEVAVELFRDEFGRPPADARELAATIAKHCRPRTNAVAGYDLTFSPVKSVSTLWAVAPPPIAAAIERAHRQAVSDALAYLEKDALFTREGAQGVRQVETRGMVAAAFTHRDSRAGDPDLHSHVAVANKVQTRNGGSWLAIDGRVLFKATVAASETYNTRLEHHLRRALGVRFAARPDPDSRKRVVREIVGVDPALNQLWSARRAAIESRREHLATTFQSRHGRPPTPIESIQLAQRATLETRDAKHEPRSLEQQRATWAREAAHALGGSGAVTAMVATALAPRERRAPAVDSAWVRSTAQHIHHSLEIRRSHWQRWHIEAEALRQVRGLELDTAAIDRVGGLLVEEVLASHSVRLTRHGDDVEVPAALQRSDGASVYTVAGADLFTSRELLTAEARIVNCAGRHDGMAAPADTVEVALRDMAANGLALNAGQATLVSEMATSGARLQLAIAPAGAGKTTAMRALAQAWTEAGGTVIGVAPSAAAASVLGDNLDASTDTMAKLTWHLDNPDSEPLPAWAQSIGPGTLVVVDEAGMADTLTLDKVVGFVMARGGSLRLIGDDQQLASVGAGGVLRDIQATHGSLHLTELMRFADPAEGAASLALREGLPESLGFYLDRNRIHVGDLATMTDDVFAGWCSDRSSGSDAIMLAPTRELVAELNDRARLHRLLHEPETPSRAVTLADGCAASVGDAVITRTNNRALRMTATDWVKNGDRWTITAVDSDGSMAVQHRKNGHLVHLPGAYVRASVELGYATTIHAAQGVTADSSHTVLTGAESRQLVYTAATRGRATNHLYLEVVGDGDEHNLIRPESTHPLTASDLLERILSRDEAALSASTMRRRIDDPATQLGQAVARYMDSLHVAAEAVLGPEHVARLDALADEVVPDLTRAAAWPTLRAHVILRSAHGLDPVEQLRQVATIREVDTAMDVASVLDWRLDDTGLRSAGTGPLPWLPGIPDNLADDRQWGLYLGARAARVRDLRDQVATAASGATQLPAWARQGQGRPDLELLADVAIWRAAAVVDDSDQRPTGPLQTSKAAYRYQAWLNDRLLAGRTPALAEWGPTLDSLLIHPRRDPFTPLLAERLAALTRAGINAPALLRQALEQGSLPDDHAASALWWRMAGHLSPAVAAQAGGDHPTAASWTPRLDEILGADQAHLLRSSSWWPTLVAVVDHALARGAAVDNLLTTAVTPDDDLDLCQALVWRISIQNDQPPEPEEATHPLDGGNADDEPNPFWDSEENLPGLSLTADEWVALRPLDHDEAPVDPADEEAAPALHTDVEVDASVIAASLELAARARQYEGVLGPSDRELEALLARAYEDDTAPVSPVRILELNRLALEFFTARYPGSWAQQHLAERTHVDLTGDTHLLPGYAPAGWTTLVSHLRRQGATDLELIESGLATTTRDGRLIDRFRDRFVLPITRLGTDGSLEPLGFVGRRRDDAHGPKYLNSPDTPLFHKGAQLYAPRHDLLSRGATPVLVEGPMDALAVTLAGDSRFVGVAPLGTALTEEQARELAFCAHSHQRRPIIATDADHAGQMAARRAFWLLAQHNVDITVASLLPDTDPADVLSLRGPLHLRTALNETSPMSDALIAERLAQPHRLAAAREAVTVVAASDPSAWGARVAGISASTHVPEDMIRRDLANAVRRWGEAPRAVAQDCVSLDAPRGRSAVTSPTRTSVVTPPAAGEPHAVPRRAPGRSGPAR